MVRRWENRSCKLGGGEGRRPGELVCGCTCCPGGKTVLWIQATVVSGYSLHYTLDKVYTVLWIQGTVFSGYSLHYTLDKVYTVLWIQGTVVPGYTLHYTLDKVYTVL